MKRKTFLRSAAAGSIGAIAVGCNRSDETTEAGRERPSKPRMKLGCQSGPASRENLEFKARHGVFHFDPGQPERIEGVGWNLDDSLRIVEAADEYGISIDAYHLSGGNSHFDLWPNIMLGRSPGRDREIEMMQQMIEVAAKSGVHLLLYNMTILPVLRTERTVDPVRGNASYSTWNYEEALERRMHEEMTEAGIVDRDEMFERITYCLDRVLPVAEEFNVKMGCHIPDPPVEPGYRGITRWNSPDMFEGLMEFARLYDSSMHGFNFCVGTAGQGLEDPATEIFPILEWVGERGKLFNIHLRNIKGGWNHFQEVYPDNGDMNFVKVMRTLRDVGFDGMVMPDHVPSHPDPGARDQAFAFAYGYIRALIQMLEVEAEQV